MSGIRPQDFKDTLIPSLKAKTALGDDFVDMLVELCVEEIYRFYAGNQVYIQHPNRYPHPLRKEILKRFNGRNVDELSKKFGYTREGIKLILMNRKMLKRESLLFDEKYKTT